MAIHPDVQNAMNAVVLPEVQKMMARLAKYGLAIAVPHKHDTEGNFAPLPNNEVGVERGLKVEFLEAGDPAAVAGTPVMWRWDGESRAASVCYSCSKKRYHRDYSCT